MKRKFLFLSLILSLTVSFPPAKTAKANSIGSLLLLSKQQIWVWNGQSLTQITHNKEDSNLAQSVSSPVVSADGRYAAYNYGHGELGYDGPTPSDIYLVDLETNLMSSIAGQPADLPSADEFGNTTRTGYFRSYPTWSPDGDWLAWTEFLSYRTTAEDEELIVYDVVHKQRHVLTKLRFNPVGLRWGFGGIAIFSGDGYGNPDGDIYIYSSNGEFLSKLSLDGDYYWIKDGGKEMIAIATLGKDSDVQWLLADPMKGYSVIPMQGEPELSRDNSKRKNVFAITDDDFEWTAYWPDGAEYKANAFPYSYNGYGEIFELSISPDGSQIAYIDQNSDAYVVSAGKARKIASEIDGLAWTFPQWTLASQF